MYSITHISVIWYDDCSNGCGKEIFPYDPDAGHELYRGVIFWPNLEGSIQGSEIEVFTCSKSCHEELQRKMQR